MYCCKDQKLLAKIDQLYLLFLNIADLVLQADKAVFNICLIALVSSGRSSQIQLQRAQGIGRVWSGAARSLRDLLRAFGGVRHIKDGGRRLVHHLA